MVEIILASKSKVREKILKEYEIICSVKPSNIDEEPVNYGDSFSAPKWHT